MESPQLLSKEPDLEKLRLAHRHLITDPKRALSELEELAECGSLMSLVYLGYIFEEGRTVPADLGKAKELYHRAYDGGSTTAAFCLGDMARKAGDTEKAKGWFEIGIGRGDPRAMYWLARQYLAENPRSRAEALALLERAYALGHLRSGKAIAVMRISGSSGLRGFLRGLWLYLRFAALVLRIAVTDPMDNKLKDLSW